MTDEQIENFIRFETELAKIHAKRANDLKAYLHKRRARRAKKTAQQTSEEILRKLSEQASQQ